MSLHFTLCHEIVTMVSRASLLILHFHTRFDFEALRIVQVCFWSVFYLYENSIRAGTTLIGMGQWWICVCFTVESPYIVVCFLQIINTPHSLSIKARHGVSFLSSWSELSFSFLCYVLCSISWYIRPRYIESLWYIVSSHNWARCCNNVCKKHWFCSVNGGEPFTCKGDVLSVQEIPFRR